MRKGRTGGRGNGGGRLLFNFRELYDQVDLALRVGI